MSSYYGRNALYDKIFENERGKYMHVLLVIMDDSHYGIFLGGAGVPILRNMTVSNLPFFPLFFITL